MFCFMSDRQLYDTQGNRLYINAEERAAFIATANKQLRTIQMLCHTLVYTGCRLSEALELCPQRIQFEEQAVVLRSLKKRGDKVVFRHVPVPGSLVRNLDLVYGIREIQNRGKAQDLYAPLWSWQRVQAWRHVKAVMDAAGIIDGVHKTPKGLRHAYGINAMQKGVQLNMLQKWMGHASMTTTAIYANALGVEEKQIAQRMWD